MKKSNYRIIANAIVTGEIGKAVLATENLDTIKLDKEQVLNIVKEEFGKVKDLNTMKLPKEMQFADAELANQVDFVDQLKLKEFFNK